MQAQLQYIISTCNSNRDLSNRQLQNLISLMAHTFQDTFMSIGMMFGSARNGQIYVDGGERRISAPTLGNTFELSNQKQRSNNKEQEQKIKKVQYESKETAVVPIPSPNKTNFSKKIAQKLKIEQVPSPIKTEKSQSSHISNTPQNQKPKIKAQQWVEHESNDFQNLIIMDNTIIAKSDSYIFGRNQLTPQSHAYKVRFNNIFTMVAIGVIDSSYKNQLNLKQLPHRIMFRNDACINVNKTWQRNSKFRPFKINQTLTVSIDFQKGIFICKDSLSLHRCSIKCEYLLDKSIKWVPYLCLRSKDDRVSIYL